MWKDNWNVIYNSKVDMCSRSITVLDMVDNHSLAVHIFSSSYRQSSPLSLSSLLMEVLLPWMSTDFARRLSNFYFAALLEKADIMTI